MPIEVPLAVPTASGWQVADYGRAQAASAPAAGGIAQLELPQLAGEQMWLVDHAVIACTSATPTQARWYDSWPADGNLLDGTDSGNFDVADWPAGLVVRPSTSVVVRWTGASAGAVGTIVVQYRLLRRV